MNYKAAVPISRDLIIKLVTHAGGLSSLQKTVFPNPGNGIYSVTLTGFGPEPRAAMYTSAGKPVEFTCSAIGTEMMIDITGQPNGLYILEIADNEHQQCFKLLKQ